MHTEAEAKTKWCPMGPTHHVPGSNMPGAPEVDDLKSRARCIGSSCMMWRSGGLRNVLRRDGTGNVELVPEGYCGLAGKPA